MTCSPSTSSRDPAAPPTAAPRRPRANRASHTPCTAPAPRRAVGAAARWRGGGSRRWLAVRTSRTSAWTRRLGALLAAALRGPHAALAGSLALDRTLFHTSLEDADCVSDFPCSALAGFLERVGSLLCIAGGYAMVSWKNAAASYLPAGGHLCLSPFDLLSLSALARGLFAEAFVLLGERRTGRGGRKER